MTRKMALVIASKMPTMRMAMLMMMTMTTLLDAASADCGAVCLSDELKQIRKSLEEVEGLKQTLKDMQHSIYTNKFFITRNWKAVSASPAEFFCPKEMPNSCYLFVEEKKTWNGAQQYCMGKRGHLVAIETWEENNYLKNQINGLNTGSQAWWTGGSNGGVPGQWMWKIPNGVDEAVKYHDWESRQPDNAGRKETVIELRSTGHRWNDRANTVKSFFICEYDKPKE